MGRSIRRVPPDWEHPRKDGQFLPLFDQDFDSAAKEWLEALRMWETGEDPARALEENREGHRAYYWETDGPPEREYYRSRVWTSEKATAYQVYENVSEGTPVSPVLPTVDALREWLRDQGYSEKAADRFIKEGWVMAPDGRWYDNIHAYDVIP